MIVKNIKEKNMPQIIVYLNEELNKLIEQEAESLKISKTDMILRILDKYYDKGEN